MGANQDLYGVEAKRDGVNRGLRCVRRKEVARASPKIVSQNWQKKILSFAIFFYLGRGDTSSLRSAFRPQIVLVHYRTLIVLFHYKI